MFITTHLRKEPLQNFEDIFSSPEVEVALSDRRAMIYCICNGTDSSNRSFIRLFHMTDSEHTGKIAIKHEPFTMASVVQIKFVVLGSLELQWSCGIYYRHRGNTP